MVGVCVKPLPPPLDIIIKMWTFDSLKKSDRHTENVWKWLASESFLRCRSWYLSDACCWYPVFPVSRSGVPDLVWGVWQLTVPVIPGLWSVSDIQLISTDPTHPPRPEIFQLSNWRGKVDRKHFVVTLSITVRIVLEISSPSPVFCLPVLRSSVVASIWICTLPRTLQSFKFSKSKNLFLVLTSLERQSKIYKYQQMRGEDVKNIFSKSGN